MVEVGEGAGLEEGVAVGVIDIAGGDGLLGVHQEGDVAIAVGVVVGRFWSTACIINSGEHAADAAGAFEGAAEVFAAGVGDSDNIVTVAFLDGEVAVVEVTGFVGELPRVVCPCVVAGNPSAQFAVSVVIRARPLVGLIFGCYWLTQILTLSILALFSVFV